MDNKDNLNIGIEKDESGNNENPNFMIEQKESIKLIRGQKGTYGWEIKILSLDVEVLVNIDKKLREKFGDVK